MSGRRKIANRTPVRSYGCEACINESAGIGACVVHPAPEVLILIGGALHGQVLELPRGTASWVHLPTATRYLRQRVAQFVAAPGARSAERAYEHDYLLHETVPDPNVGYQLLQQAVVHLWFMTGAGRPMTEAEKEQDAVRRQEARYRAEQSRRGVVNPQSRLLLPGTGG